MAFPAGAGTQRTVDVRIVTVNAVRIQASITRTWNPATGWPRSSGVTAYIATPYHTSLSVTRTWNPAVGWTRSAAVRNFSIVQPAARIAIPIPQSSADTGIGSSINSIVASVSSADSGAGADGFYFSPASADTGVGAESFGTIEVAANAEVGTGADDNHIDLSYTGVEIGVAVDLLIREIADSQSGFGQESFSIGVTGTETGIAVDANLVQTDHLVSDQGHLVGEAGWLTILPYIPPPPPPVGPPVPSALRGLFRWRFDDPETGESYVFAVNPNAGGSTEFHRTVSTTPTTAPDGITLLAESNCVTLQTSSWSGVLYSEAQYAAMVEWIKKPYPIQLTDDLGRVRRVLLATFQPKRERNPSRPWKHTYTMNYYLSEVELAGAGLP